MYNVSKSLVVLANAEQTTGNLIDTLITDVLKTAAVRPDLAKLAACSDLSHVPGLADKMLPLYRHRDLNPRLLAAWLNGIFTGGKPVFLFSRSVMEDLLASDPYSKRKTLSGDEFKDFLAFLFGNGFLKKHREPIAKVKAGVYELVHAGWNQLLDQTNGTILRQHLRENACRVYDEMGINKKSSEIPSSKTSTDLESESESESDGEHIITGDKNSSEEESIGNSKHSAATSLNHGVNLPPVLVTNKYSREVDTIFAALKNDHLAKKAEETLKSVFKYFSMPVEDFARDILSPAFRRRFKEKDADAEFRFNGPKCRDAWVIYIAEYNRLLEEMPDPSDENATWAAGIRRAERMTRNMQ